MLRVAGARPDDVLDAMIACWTAERHFFGKARRYGCGERDARGLLQEIWA